MTTVVCPGCGKAFAAFQSFCDNCGSPLARAAQESVDLREAQGVVYKPSGPVDSQIGDRITAPGGDVATGDGNTQVQIGDRITVQGDLIIGARPGDVVELEPSPEARQLHRIIVKRLDIEDFRTLCVELGIDYDSLGGEGLSAKARQLLLYLQKRDQLGRLSEWIRRERPDIKL